MKAKDDSLYRELEWWEYDRLEKQGCICNDWTGVRITPETDLSLIRNVEFRGEVSIGALQPGISDDTGIRNVVVTNCSFGNNVAVSSCRLRNAKIGDRARISNVGSLEFDPEATCGIGTPVSVLDETGSHQVRIFPGLSAQLATLMAREPQWTENNLSADLNDMLINYTVEPAIGANAVIENVGHIRNVAVGNEVHIEGAQSLVNGLVINNAAVGRAFAGIGYGVDAENFIIEDGYVGSGALLRNCYVGQGAQIEKGFSAHDSIFFANCSLENGEACALLAGPYTVSMHKSSLLIGCQTSFMNAGSGTNQSNHLYKLGPIHWGVLERGVKTSSDSYLMLGAKIGAFSLLMGQHKTHPDSSEFPFSYLFGDDRGATVVVPAAMLRSCGLLRDEMKWPTRDRRLRRKLPMHDHIIFDVLNPLTVERMIKALSTISELLARPADDDHYLRYKGMKLTRAGLERARHLYSLAIYKYIDRRRENNDHAPDPRIPEDDGLDLLIKNPFEMREDPSAKEDPDSWVDLSGQLIPRSYLQLILETETLEEAEAILESAWKHYERLQQLWIESAVPEEFRDPVRVRIYTEEFNKIVEEDRRLSREAVHRENDMLKL